MKKEKKTRKKKEEKREKKANNNFFGLTNSPDSFCINYTKILLDLPFRFKILTKSISLLIHMPDAFV